MKPVGFRRRGAEHDKVTDEDLRQALARALEEVGSQGALAKAAGVSQTMVSLGLSGRRPIRGRLLTFLGFEIQTVVAPMPVASPDTPLKDDSDD